ncbi:MAG: hypothetical protein O2834_03845 [Crenarchaeota archaeon]|nr:hypothetical protein [Thermoproteota archaeon]HJJ21635.1 hypothetical protein [Nitrosopumilus sp.]HJJ23860.1 hypothetical protein [Nitrosopumilus sp.]HJJ25669.1 hypothetical protein [Nitrosopumilus sp.]
MRNQDMSKNKNTLYFDHEGQFEMSVDDGILTVDVNSVERIIFTDHANMIKYTFSKIRTEMINDVYPIVQTELQGN